ncbi:MAG: carboxypeptidase-like regulatory domain-containing protein [Planctomycetota bacterium]
MFGRLPVKAALLLVFLGLLSLALLRSCSTPEQGPPTEDAANGSHGHAASTGTPSAVLTKDGNAPGRDVASAPPAHDNYLLGRVVLRRRDGGTEAVAASLKCIPLEGEAPEPEALASAEVLRTAEDGSFVLECAGQRVYCAAQHDDGVTTGVACQLPADEQVLTLPPAGKIEVRLPGNSRPFRVNVSPGGATNQAGMISVAARGEVARCVGIPLEWQTARVTVVREGGGRMDAGEPVTLGFRQWSIVTVESPDRVGIVRGTVVDAHGAPVHGARVHLYVDGGQEAATPEHWDQRSMVDGTFNLRDLPPGSFELLVTKDGMVSVRRAIQLGQGELEDLGTLLLTSGTTVQGRVLRSDSTSSRLTVTISTMGRLSDHSMVSGRRQTPDVSGSYRFDGVEPGDWIVAVFPGRLEPLRTPWTGTRIHVEPGQPLVVAPDLEPVITTEWAASVLGSPGVDLSGCLVIARGVDTPWATYGRVDDTGTVTMQVARGRFLLGLSVERTLRWCGVQSLSSRVVEVPSGSITLTTNTPIEQDTYLVTVVYEVVPAWTDIRFPLQSEVARIQPSGTRHELRHLPAGSYRILVQRDGDTRETTVTLHEAGQHETARWPF